ncbi:MULTISPECIES: primosomal replication protein N [Shewanella]|uniref:Replication restart protein PriB n=2 Tax=Shewanella TaxID=22 RepID=A0AAJ1BJ67_9GAMM|nr:primosomal replication protein N [Shewanella khirikhana]MCH4295753.1 primosomal replication protein N [Shewanella zhuhaiensis]
MTANTLVLTGSVLRVRRFKSPAGIPHCVLQLEHRSQRFEAEMPRNVYCQIQVIMSGQHFECISDTLQAGMEIQVQGFLSTQQSRNGQSRLVIHAENVELKS